jgi:hypothetical protein
MRIQGIPAEIETPTHGNLMIRSMTVFAAGVIAQQYSSATFVSLCFHSRKDKFGPRFENIIF